VKKMKEDIVRLNNKINLLKKIGEIKTSIPITTSVLLMLSLIVGLSGDSLFLLEQLSIIQIVVTFLFVLLGSFFIGLIFMVIVFKLEALKKARKKFKEL